GLGAVGVRRALVLLSPVGVGRALLAHLTLLARLVLATHFVLAHLVVMALRSRATLLRGLADRAALVLVAAHFILALHGRAALVGSLADSALVLAALHVLSLLAGAGRLLGLAGLHAGLRGLTVLRRLLGSPTTGRRRALLNGGTRAFTARATST